jgi:hypothetical protein
MAQNQSNGTVVPPRAAKVVPWPDNSVRGVEMDARAVVAEAYAVERESGGWPFAGASFADLRLAAQELNELCEALQSEDLDAEQRQLLADAAPKIEALTAELSGESPDVVTIEEVLAAAERLKELCSALREEEPDKDWGFLDDELFPAIDDLIRRIRAFERAQIAGKPERRAARDTKPRGEKK